ncbi:hypothetical protein [Rhodopirellula bahusiensis]|uniref:Uncharacterized protein n=1 Tax=Rhodopirellula bahusiensis TaxID=2014065 RepID=A0A2G1W4R1_9BACT|nr:hypothetical protein [Rhodopirellula bahusiensis]PHQ34034.1 hypothetical protein CEE69_17185 [Rhodopirellula bahusiensis]
MRLLLPLVIVLFAATGRHSLSADDDLFQIVGEQATLTFELKVTNDKGDPIDGAEVTPWALRSSQGHGVWRADGEDQSKMKPTTVATNRDGIAIVAYPFYRDASENTRTLQVSVRVRHDSFCLEDSVHIDVPPDDVFPVEMKPAASIGFRPTIEDSDDFRLDQIRVVRSDVGSWSNSFHSDVRDGQVCVDQLYPAECDFLLVRILNGKATHFSEVFQVTLAPGLNDSMDVPLQPAVSISGELEASVPRPVNEGRILAKTVPPKSARDRLTWSTWAPIDAEGNFHIEAWPKNEPIQIIGLTESHRVRSPQSADRLNSNFGHPVVTEPPFTNSITLEMEPLHSCRISMVDLDDTPIDAIKVSTYPNVKWKNWGSQVYGRPLTRSEDYFDTPDLLAYFQEQRSHPLFPSTFVDITGDDGISTLRLPTGKWNVHVHDDRFEIPIVLGRRGFRLEVSGEVEQSFEVRLVPKGTDLLGDYDKLAGVVFGCSTREGERICALPEVREKIDEFVRQIQAAEDPQDPKILSEAFMVVSDAFVKAGDQQEAAKWRRKALKMKVKLTKSISENNSSD